jgi:hypothetical protein
VAEASIPQPAKSGQSGTELPAQATPKLADTGSAVSPKADAASPPAAPKPPVAQTVVPSDNKSGNRFTLLAASVAIAACAGALAGAIAASSHAAAPAPAATAGSADAGRVLATSLAQLRTDLAALRTSVEASTKVVNGQFAKISERFERAQAEPAAKIAKAIEALERIEKRADVASKDITGSVTPPAASPPQPQLVEGWVLRDVYRGAAMIQGRRFGMLEVEPGDTIPGLGRVEAVRKQDGRWVVVTSKGLIVSPR